jgi:hypothetical protein
MPETVQIKVFDIMERETVFPVHKEKTSGKHTVFLIPPPFQTAKIYTWLKTAVI